MSYTSSQNINDISRQVHFMKFMTHNFVLKAKLLKRKEKVDRYKLKKNKSNHKLLKRRRKKELIAQVQKKYESMFVGKRISNYVKMHVKTIMVNNVPP